ncbi:MAG TPA: hypothetical protein VFD82_21065 [Planctomycetota bacterium]|nr:hypothetical protein [Planctomycetota bacterium]
MKRIRLLTAFLLVALPLEAQDAAFDKLVGEFEKVRQQDVDGAVAAFAKHFQDAADKHAGTDAAVPYLAWIVRNGLSGAAAATAFAALEERHAASLAIGPVLDVVPHLAPSLGNERCAAFVDKVLQASNPPELQAKAMLASAVLALQKTEVDDTGMALVTRLLEQAKKLTKDQTLVAAIERTSTERRGLKIGDVLPEVAGFDLDGVPFRLSDYRGKVVVLDFWGDW